MDYRRELQAYEAGQRAAAARALWAAQSSLVHCDDLIVEIESHGQVVDAQAQALYDAALEMRSRAIEHVDTPPQAPSVVAAASDAMDAADLAHRALERFTDVVNSIYAQKR